MNYKEFGRKDIEELLKHRIINKQEARKITGQSETAFNQAVLRGKLKPIIHYGNGRGGMNLFLREDVETYKLTMKNRYS